MILQNHTSGYGMLAMSVCICTSWSLASDAMAGGGCPLPECTITFDGSCPNDVELCGATFTGGSDCVFELLANCYSTGSFSYRIDPATPLTIELSGDLVDIEVFFANVTGSSGEMHFFNADGEEVGMPLQTNGNCLSFMPPPQTQEFDEAVRTIEVTATGGQVYIDTFRVNPAFMPPLQDLTGDCTVGIEDLLDLLAAWGQCDGCPPATCPADFNNDCQIGIEDLLDLLANWG